jgi:hypothetical protein
MGKRKRDDEVDEPQRLPDGRVSQQQLASFRGNLETGRKSLVGALRLARGFERQKMGRRQKAASKNPKNLLRLREETIVLKELDLDKVAKNHIAKSLFTAKRVRESPAFQVVYGVDPKFEPVSSPAKGNVLGRLFRSTVAMKAMASIMDSTYSVLGLDGKARKTTASRIAQKEWPTDSHDDDIPKELDPMEVTSEEEDSGHEAPASNLKDDLANSDGTDDEDEGDPEEEDDLVASSDDGSVNEGSNLDECPPLKTAKTRPAEQPRPDRTSKAGETSFLPSLSMGGYFSGPDDDSEDEEESTQPKKQRKNRRGQRARQQLAELKYGRNAKHLEKQTKSRDAGWDVRKGAVGTRGAADKTSKRSPRESRLDRPTRMTGSKTSSTSKKLSRDDSGPLHPSWEAAKLRKERAAGQKVKFEGKKVTFD